MAPGSSSSTPTASPSFTDATDRFFGTNAFADATQTFFASAAVQGQPAAGLGWGQKVGDSILRGAKQAEQSLYLLGQLAGYDMADEIARVQQDIGYTPVSPELERFMGSKTWQELLGNLTRDAGNVVPQLSAEALTQYGATALPLMGGAIGAGAGIGSVVPGAGTAAGALAGAQTGMIAGSGGTSFLMEFSGKVMEELQKRGVDTTDPEALRAAFADKQLMGELKKKGSLAGIGPAVFDAISAGMAGKLFSLARGFRQKAAALGGELVAQGAMDMEGEVVKQGLADDEWNLPSIAAEVIIGVAGPGAVETGLGLTREALAARLQQGQTTAEGQVETAPGAGIEPETRTPQEIADELDAMREAARQWLREHPEAARELADLDRPSRRQFQRITGQRLSRADDRQAAVELAREVLAEEERAATEGAETVEPAIEAPLPGEPPAAEEVTQEDVDRAIAELVGEPEAAPETEATAPVEPEVSEEVPAAEVQRVIDELAGPPAAAPETAEAEAVAEPPERPKKSLKRKPEEGADAGTLPAKEAGVEAGGDAGRGGQAAGRDLVQPDTEAQRGAGEPVQRPAEEAVIEPAAEDEAAIAFRRELGVKNRVRVGDLEYELRAAGPHDVYSPQVIKKGASWREDALTHRSHAQKRAQAIDQLVKWYQEDRAQEAVGEKAEGAAEPARPGPESLKRKAEAEVPEPAKPGPESLRRKPVEAEPAVPRETRPVMDLLAEGPKTLDQLTVGSGLVAGKLSAELLQGELAGTVKRMGGGLYARADWQPPVAEGAPVDVGEGAVFAPGMRVRHATTGEEAVVLEAGRRKAGRGEVPYLKLRRDSGAEETVRGKKNVGAYAPVSAEAAPEAVAPAEVPGPPVARVAAEERPVPGPESLKRKAEAPVAEPESIVEPESATEPEAPESAWQEPPAIERMAQGAATTVVAQGFEQGVPATYAVVELDSLVPSHRLVGEASQKQPAYPHHAELQPRRYAIGSGEYDTAKANARKQEARYWVSTHPSPTDGPPTVTRSGIVLNGNGRTMSLFYARDRLGEYGWYRSALERSAEQFGLKPEDLAGFEHPVLVRIVDLDPTGAEARAFARAGNVTGTVQQSPPRLAASLGTLIDAPLIESLQLEEDTTFSEAITDESRGRAFRDQLAEALPPTERDRFFNADRNLTAAGVEFVQYLLLGKVLPVDLMERLGEDRKGLKRAIESVVPQLLLLQRNHPRYDLSRQLPAALEFIVQGKLKPVTEAAARKEFQDRQGRAAVNADEVDQGRLHVAHQIVTEWSGQEGMFGEQVRLSPGEKMVAEAVLAYGDKPTRFREVVKNLLHEIGEDQGLFSTGRKPAQTVAEALGVVPRKGARFGVQGDAKPTARQTAQGAADTASAAEGFQAGAAFVFAGPIHERADVLPKQARAPREEIEQRLRKAYRAKGNRFIDRVRGAVVDAVHKTTRTFEHLPNDQPFFDTAKEVLRLLRSTHSAMTDEALRTVAAILEPMGPQQLAIFERLTILDNLVDSVRRGEPLRFGFENLAEAERYQQELHDLAAQIPELQTALERRRAIVQELAEGLVERHLLPEDALNRAQTYYHQQVLAHQEVRRPRGASSLEPTKRTFQRRRKKVKGEVAWKEDLDYNTSYIEAEITWMTEALVEMRTADLFRDLTETYDVLPRLKQQAKAQNFENLVGGPQVVARIRELRDLIRESWEGPNRNESDERKARAMWIAELTGIDPTYPYRVRMAKAMGLLQKELADGDYRLPERLERDWSLDEVTHETLRFLAMAYPDSQAAVFARMFFKALSEQNRMIEETLGERFLDATDLIPEGYRHFVPPPGNPFYQAWTIPERLIEALQAQLIEEAQISEADLRPVLAMGQPRQQFVLPVELVEQLQSMRKSELPGPVGQFFKGLQLAWKGWILINLKRITGYMLRNLTGDVDAVLGGLAGGVVAYRKAALRDLQRYYGGYLALPPRLREARDLGVIGSSMTAAEMPEVGRLAAFERFYRGQQGQGQKLASLPRRIWDASWTANQFREDTLRYAAYLYYLDHVQKGTLKHYGGARKSFVEEVTRSLGPEVAAGHLSRNLLGDYLNLTVMGNWLRNYWVPFYGWTETVFRRVPRMVINSFEYGAAKGKTPLSKAAYTAGSLLAIGAMYGLMHAWNRLFWREREEELTPEEAAQPHVIVGVTPHGNTMILRNVTMVGELLEWTGVNTFLALWPKYQTGQVTLEDLATEVGQAPVNRAVQGMNPFLKGGIEMTTGLSTFPDVFAPRPVARDETPARIWGLEDEYREVKGRILGTGERARQDYLARWIGVSDPRKSALYETYNLWDSYRRSQGFEDTGIYPRSKIAVMRDAAVNENWDAFVEARKYYLAQGGTFDRFKRSLGAMRPVPKTQQDAFEQWLTPGQRERMRVALDYAQETELLLWQWWQQAALADPAGEKDAEYRKYVGSLAYTASGGKDDAGEALSRLRNFGMSDAEIRDAFRQGVKGRVKYSTDSKSAYQERLRRLNRLLAQQPAHSAQPDRP